MNSEKSIIVKRDCPAVMIPSGEATTLAVGELCLGDASPRRCLYGDDRPRLYGSHRRHQWRCDRYGAGCRVQEKTSPQRLMTAERWRSTFGIN